MSNSLWHMFSNSVSKYGSKPLFHLSKHNKLSYDDVYKVSLKYREFLQTQKIKKGDTVMIIGNGSPKWAALMYAANSIGAVIVPTFDEQPDNIKLHIINQTKPKIIFNSSKQSVNNLCARSCSEIDHESLPFASGNSSINNEPDVNSHNLAMILYTSGTSGLPKGVPLTNHNILSNIGAISKCANNGLDNVTSDDKFVSFLPWNHCYGLNCELNSIVLNGASLYRNNNLLKLRDDIVTHNPTILCTVPRLFQLMHKKISWTDKVPNYLKPITNPLIKSQLFGKNLRYCTAGGSAMSQDLIDFFESYGVHVLQGYGTTECSPMISLNSSVNFRPHSVGKILDCNDVLIANSADEKTGEILVKGSNVMSNYYGYDQTESFDDQGWYKTGDVGYLEDGYLFITGRIKEQYKLSNGRFVNPAEIEGVLLQIPEIQQVVVFGKDADFNSAIIVTDSSEKIIKKKIHEISSKLKKYEVPQNIILVREQFTTENGLLTQKKSQKRNDIIKKYV